MTAPLMPKATAVWLIENTALTFEQISAFCHLHPVEVQAIANGESSMNMLGLDPIANGQLNVDEIHRCEKEPNARLVLQSINKADLLTKKKKTSKYTPVLKRQDRPDGIAWLLKYYPHLSETQICRLLGTTKAMIKSVASKTHWNSANIKPRDPVHLGLCTQHDLDDLIQGVQPVKDLDIH